MLSSWRPRSILILGLDCTRFRCHSSTLSNHKVEVPIHSTTEYSSQITDSTSTETISEAVIKPCNLLPVKRTDHHELILASMDRHSALLETVHPTPELLKTSVSSRYTVDSFDQGLQKVLNEGKTWRRPELEVALTRIPVANMDWNGTIIELARCLIRFGQPVEAWRILKLARRHGQRFNSSEYNLLVRHVLHNNDIKSMKRHLLPFLSTVFKDDTPAFISPSDSNTRAAHIQLMRGFIRTEECQRARMQHQITKERGVTIDEQSACLAILAIVRCYVPRGEGFALKAFTKELEGVMEQMIAAKVHMSGRIARVIFRELDSLANQCTPTEVEELKVITFGLARMMGFKLGAMRKGHQVPSSSEVFEETRPPDSYLFLALVDHIIASAERDVIVIAKRLRQNPTRSNWQELRAHQNTFLERHSSLKPFVDYLEHRGWSGLAKEAGLQTYCSIGHIRARLCWMEAIRSHLLLRYYVLASDFNSALRCFGGLILQRSLLVKERDQLKHLSESGSISAVERTLYTVNRFITQGYNRMFAVAIGQTNVDALMRVLQSSPHLLQCPEHSHIFSTSWKRSLSVMMKGTVHLSPASDIMFSALQLLLKIYRSTGLPADRKQRPFAKAVIWKIFRNPERRAQIFVHCINFPLMSACKTTGVDTGPNIQDVIQMRLTVLMELFTELQLKKPVSLTAEKVKVMHPERRKTLIEFLNSWEKMSLMFKPGILPRRKTLHRVGNSTKKTKIQ